MNIDATCGPQAVGYRIGVARVGQATQLAPLLRAEAEQASTTAACFELEPGFDWVGYARQRLGGDDCCLLVAESANGELLGFIDLRLRRAGGRSRPRGWLGRFRRQPDAVATPLALVEWGWIGGCFVEPAWRRRGVGRRLVQAGLDWLRRKGMARVELAALAEGDAASFWRHCGFNVYRLGMSRELDP